MTQPLFDEYESDFGDTDSGQKFLTSTPSLWHEANTLQGVGPGGVDLTQIALGFALDAVSFLWKSYTDTKKHPHQVALEARITPYMQEARQIAVTYKEHGSAFMFCFMGLLCCGFGCYLVAQA